MTFNIATPSSAAIITSYTDNGVPYLYGSGDISTEASIAYPLSTPVGSSVAAAIGCGRMVFGSPTFNLVRLYTSVSKSYIGTITGSDSVSTDSFGRSVAIGCGRIVVGAPTHDIGANSNQGAAYIFDLNGTQLAKITASDGAASDEFGTSVAIGFNRIVVGARLDDVGANSNQGSAYIFDLNGTQLAKITASDGTVSDEFGYSVAVGCGRIVVGAYRSISTRGSAYIFDLDGNELAKITASDGAVGDQFGEALAIGSGIIVVGAPYDDTVSINGGSAYIFDLNGNQLYKINPPDLINFGSFGERISIGSGRIAITNLRYDSFDGAVYLFDLSGNLIDTMVETVPSDTYGRAMAVNDGHIIVASLNSLYAYDTPRIYTPYDILDIAY